MAHYIPDPKMEAAKKLVESLDPEDERDGLILYYIERESKAADELLDAIRKYREFFDTLSELLPRRPGDVILR